MKRVNSQKHSFVFTEPRDQDKTSLEVPEVDICVKLHMSLTRSVGNRWKMRSDKAKTDYAITENSDAYRFESLKAKHQWR